METMQQLSAAALALEASLAQQLDGLPTKARPLILSGTLKRVCLRRSCTVSVAVPDIHHSLFRSVRQPAQAAIHSRAAHPAIRHGGCPQCTLCQKVAMCSAVSF